MWCWCCLPRVISWRGPGCHAPLMFIVYRFSVDDSQGYCYPLTCFVIFHARATLFFCFSSSLYIGVRELGDRFRVAWNCFRIDFIFIPAPSTILGTNEPGMMCARCVVLLCHSSSSSVFVPLSVVLCLAWCCRKINTPQYFDRFTLARGWPRAVALYFFCPNCMVRFCFFCMSRHSVASVLLLQAAWRSERAGRADLRLHVGVDFLFFLYVFVCFCIFFNFRSWGLIVCCCSPRAPVFLNRVLCLYWCCCCSPRFEPPALLSVSLTSTMGGWDRAALCCLENFKFSWILFDAWFSSLTVGV